MQIVLKPPGAGSATAGSTGTRSAIAATRRTCSPPQFPAPHRTWRDGSAPFPLALTRIISTSQDRTEMAIGRRGRVEYLAHLAEGRGSGCRFRGGSSKAFLVANARFFACQRCGYLVNLRSAYVAARARGSMQVGDACTRRTCVSHGNWRSRFWDTQIRLIESMLNGDARLVVPPKSVQQNPLTEIVGTAKVDVALSICDMMGRF